MKQKIYFQNLINGRNQVLQKAQQTLKKITIKKTTFDTSLSNYWKTKMKRKSLKYREK